MRPSIASAVSGFLSLLVCLASSRCYAGADVQDSLWQPNAFAVLPPDFSSTRPDGTSPDSPSREHQFTLRHVFHHGTHKYPRLFRRLDIPKNGVLRVADEDGNLEESGQALRAKSQPLSIQRLADRRFERIDALLDAGRNRGSPVTLDAAAWTVDEVPGPNITDKETVLSMARIAANAYILDDSAPDWRDVGSGFNYTEDFGWDNDGLRGHIFADTENRTVVVGIKGTSPAVFDGSDTTTNDKINDNLFFSCCCGQGGQFSWKQVCECQTSAFRCNSTCVVEALRHKNRYYYAAQEIYRNVTELYPDADIWLVGHSLGGSTSSLVALTYGVPVVTFEAPGDAMAAARLGLPTPPGYALGFHQQREMTGGYHFGNTADPIFMGTCNTISSFCSIAGYAMQSVCHTGLTCTYDTVGDFGWRSGVGNHRIKVVVKDVLEKYDAPAECKPMTNCSDCFNWEYFESHHSDPATTTTTSKTTTKTTTSRTSTCKTPGWWGCLDETTIQEITTTSAKSPDTETTSHLTTTHNSTSTTSCKSPGWFGCKDPTTVPLTTTSAASSPSEPTIPPSTSPSTPSTADTGTSTGASPTCTQSTSCLHRAWYGRCTDWTTVPSPPPPTALPNFELR